MTWRERNIVRTRYSNRLWHSIKNVFYFRSEFFNQKITGGRVNHFKILNRSRTYIAFFFIFIEISAAFKRTLLASFNILLNSYLRTSYRDGLQSLLEENLFLAYKLYYTFNISISGC